MLGDFASNAGQRAVGKAVDELAARDALQYPLYTRPTQVAHRTGGSIRAVEHLANAAGAADGAGSPGGEGGGQHLLKAETPAADELQGGVAHCAHDHALSDGGRGRRCDPHGRTGHTRGHHRHHARKDDRKRLVDAAGLEVVGIGAEAALGVEPDELLVDQLGDATRVKLGVGALHARRRLSGVVGVALLIRKLGTLKVQSHARTCKSLISLKKLTSLAILVF